jgi:hypothetical protein
MNWASDLPESNNIPYLMLHILVVDSKIKTLLHLGQILPNEKTGSAGRSPRFRERIE